MQWSEVIRMLDIARLGEKRTVRQDKKADREISDEDK